MKIFKKKNNKKGFTLVEVMLSVAIMAIASLMIMQGFLSTMNLAHNSSVYSRVGGTNYQAAVQKMSTYSGMSARDTTDTANNRYRQLASDSDVTIGGAGVRLTFAANVTDVSNPSYRIAGWRFTMSSSDGANVLGNASESYNSTDSSQSYSANRTSFFYAARYVCDHPGCSARGQYTVRHAIVRNATTGAEIGRGWYCTVCHTDDVAPAPSI